MGLWQRLTGSEKRQEHYAYTDTLVQLIQSQASGGSALPAATAALEASSGFVGRAFASADTNTAVLDPPILSLIGRSLVRRGEFVAVIKMGRGDDTPRLAPAASWDIVGDEDPKSWTYRLTLAGPSKQTTIENVAADGVVHIRYASDQNAPHRGIGPLQSAHLAGRLSAEVSAALADELSGPRGSLLPLPNVDGADPSVASLKADIRGLGGGLAFVEAMSDQFGSGPTNNPSQGWTTQRIGSTLPTSSIEAAKLAFAEVTAACGLSVALWGDGEGTASREAFRQALHSVLVPLGRLVSSELTAKLETDVQIDWTALGAGDISGRARAFQSLVGGGMEISKAASLSGLMTTDDD